VLNDEQVVHNGDAVAQAWGNRAPPDNTDMGAGIVSGLQGAKGIDVNEHFVAVAGSHSNAVVLFARHHDGSITFLNHVSVGLRSIPSFHHRFNPQPLTLSGPTYVTSSESESSVSSHSNPETLQTSFALDHGHGPVRLQHTLGNAVSASDAAAFTISGRHYLAVANQDGLGGGGVSVFLLHRQPLVCEYCQLHVQCTTETFLCWDVQEEKQGLLHLICMRRPKRALRSWRKCRG
jgi:hypothetical protein